MRYNDLGPLKAVSRLTLGGGGLGQLWGETTEEEARATIHAALDAGVNLLDTAPSYKNCEAVIQATFAGALPQGVRITTKCYLGEPDPGTAAALLEASLDASLRAMGLDFVDIFFLHTNICEDDSVYAFGPQHRRAFATPWSLYRDEVAPAFEELRRRGRIGAWGVTGVGLPGTVIKAMRHDVKPAAVQAIANLMDSPGAIRRYSEPARPREVIAAAKTAGVGVMGIRAVQAGALTANLDRPLKDSHPEAADYRRALPFRTLCRSLSVDPALLAHRYALEITGVDTVVLGVKNRSELAQCLEAEKLGPLPPEIREAIDGLGLREPV